MNQGSYNLGNDEVKEESSWRYPLMIFFATLILCVIFLYHYVGPDVEEIQGNKPRPTISDEVFRITVGAQTFAIPANYTVYPRARRDGQRETLELYASWPRMEGYVPARRDDFVENAHDSRRVDISIIEKRTPFNESQRYDVLFLPNVIDPEGQPFEHELTRYSFRQGQGSNTAVASGYLNKEMLVGTDATGQQAIFFCYPGSAEDIVPPECFREFDLSETVSVKYRFKHPYLPEWQQLDARVREMIAEFVVQPTALTVQN